MIQALESRRSAKKRFSIHILKSKPPPPGSVAARGRQLAGLRVLIVDDNTNSHRAVADSCGRWGLSVDVAESGTAGLEMIRHANTIDVPYHFVLMDAEMTEMSGFQMARQLRASTDITGGLIMMINACAVPEHVKQCDQLGVFRYLVKPVMPTDLLEAMLAAFVVAS